MRDDGKRLQRRRAKSLGMTGFTEDVLTLLLFFMRARG